MSGILGRTETRDVGMIENILIALMLSIRTPHEGNVTDYLFETQLLTPDTLMFVNGWERENGRYYTVREYYLAIQDSSIYSRIYHIDNSRTKYLQWDLRHKQGIFTAGVAMRSDSPSLLILGVNHKGLSAEWLTNFSENKYKISYRYNKGPFFIKIRLMDDFFQIAPGLQYVFN